MTVMRGETRTFFSTMQGQDGDGNWPALYSAHKCVIGAPLPDVDEDSEPMFKARFSNGVELEVFEGEVNGWYFDTCQWHGPFSALQEGCPTETFNAVAESLREGGKA